MQLEETLLMMAMIEAMKSGKIFALGLDVYNGEPKINEEYLN